MSDHSLLRLEVPMLILEFLNVKIVGDGDTQLSLAGSKSRSASNAMAPTNWKTTANSDGVAKPTKKQILHDLKPKKENYVSIHSSVQIAEVTTKPTLLNARSGNIVSIENGNKRNTSRSVKIGPNQFAL